MLLGTFEEWSALIGALFLDVEEEGCFSASAQPSIRIRGKLKRPIQPRQARLAESRWLSIEIALGRQLLHLIHGSH